MAAHRWVWLSCDVVDELPGDAECHETTMPDLYVAGASPSTVRQAEQDYQAKGWHQRPGGRYVCPAHWEAGAR